ncbi:MAG: AraC family transcriptional regulator ligand-binding domain-containing protein [Deltaproteobacteria bacterium]|nr:AraC family transcriptional regulator ligand-binding domain-containing protein [Deltaproteobacteria bacterium]
MRPGAPGIAREIVGPVILALSELGFRSDGFSANEAIKSGVRTVLGSSADEVFDRAAEALGDEAIGLHVAERVPIGALGELDYALCTSPCLGVGLARVAKYYEVVTERARLSLRVDESLATLELQRLPGLHHSRHWIEFAIAMISTRIKQTVGASMSFASVSFAHVPPSRTAIHDRFFGLNTNFGAACDSIKFEARHLERSLQTAASALAEVLDSKLRESLRARESDPFLEQVESTLRASLADGEVGLDALALRLATSRRTLQRELASRQTSYHGVLDRVRRDEASRLLDGGRLTVAEVSERLSFSEPSAFFRAYRRWTGSTPRARSRE